MIIYYFLVFALFLGLIICIVIQILLIITIGNDEPSIVNCGFLITECGMSILGLEDLRLLQGQLSLFNTGNGSNEKLDKLLAMESQCEKITPDSNTPSFSRACKRFQSLENNR